MSCIAHPVVTPQGLTAAHRLEELACGAASLDGSSAGRDAMTTAAAFRSSGLGRVRQKLVGLPFEFCHRIPVVMPGKRTEAGFFLELHQGLSPIG